MEREKFESLLESGNEPISPHNRRLLLAEFDRLKLRVAALAADLWDAQAALDEAQSWLATICEPIKEWLKSIPPDSKSWDEHKMAYAFKAVDAIADYLDSQKPSERQPQPYSPVIVCLCGSTRFSKAFQDAQLRETLAGKIVLTIGCNMRSDTEIFGHMSQEELDETKRKLDELHLRKIEMADEVLILDVDGYIGKSTTNELNYAKTQGKRIRFLSQEEKPSEKSQPAEGELAPDSMVENLLRSLPTCVNYTKDLAVHWEIVKASFKAQLAHDKARMVKLPSEKELALWLVGHLEYTSSELAKKLLKFMEEA